MEKGVRRTFKIKTMNFYKKRAFQTEHLDYYNYIEPIPNGSYLDIGCADRNGINIVNAKHKFGIDVYKSHPKTIVCDMNKDKIPLNPKSIDIVSSFEVIEHLSNTEHFIKQIRRVLKTNGTLYISTPNLSWWINRILLLFGYQPANTEVDLYHSMYGKPKIFKDNIGSGHIHLFTYRAMGEFLIANHFEIIKIKSDYSHYKGILKIFNFIDKILSYIPSLARGYIYICKKSI